MHSFLQLLISWGLETKDNWGGRGREKNHWHRICDLTSAMINETLIAFSLYRHNNFLRSALIFVKTY